jgi:two-component system response regulator CssR
MKCGDFMKTICFVEDEKHLINLMISYLEKEGYKVIPCESGEEAFEVSDKVDLWILDIMLKGNLSGYDVIKKIRAEDNFVPVIFASARDTTLDKEIGLELDADEYITKPYSPKELVLRVNK